MNNQGQLQCRQDPQDVTRVGSAKELPLCREKPIFHEPVGASVTDKEQLTNMYPNSFNRVGSLKGEYIIKIDPTVPPVLQARCKVTIESKEAICAALDQMIKGQHTGATDRTDTMGKQRNISSEAVQRGETVSRLCATEQGHHQRESHTAFLHASLKEKQRAYHLRDNNPWQASIQENAIRHENEPDVFQIQMDRILEQCPGTIGIHNDVIIYGYTRKTMMPTSLISSTSARRKAFACLQRSWSFAVTGYPSLGQSICVRELNQTPRRYKALRK